MIFYDWSRRVDKAKRQSRSDHQQRIEYTSRAINLRTLPFSDHVSRVDRSHFPLLIHSTTSHNGPSRNTRNLPDFLRVRVFPICHAKFDLLTRSSSTSI